MQNSDSEDPLPFSKEISDPFFMKEAAKLFLSGVPFSMEELHHAFLECMDHIVLGTSVFGECWEKFKPDEIDVRKKEAGLFYLLSHKTEHVVIDWSEEIMMRSYRLRLAARNRHVATVTNAFLNAMVRALAGNKIVQV